MTAELERTRAGIRVVLGLVLVTVAAVAAVPTFPLAAPAVAALGVVACHLVHRRFRQTLIVPLMVVNLVALIAAGAIDLFLLNVGGDVSPPPR